MAAVFYAHQGPRRRCARLLLDRPQPRPRPTLMWVAGIHGLPSFDDPGRDPECRRSHRSCRARSAGWSSGRWRDTPGGWRSLRRRAEEPPGWGTAIAGADRDLLPGDGGERRRLRPPRTALSSTPGHASSASPKSATTSAASLRR
ncbi:MAG: hypothetical protein MZV63_65650 [Marinilabiliales bacterium]|nr:hypothetical protein [Marinilabiliales bacterium]